jgi:hypothetical protein
MRIPAHTGPEHLSVIARSVYHGGKICAPRSRSVHPGIYFSRSLMSGQRSGAVRLTHRSALEVGFVPVLVTEQLVHRVCVDLNALYDPKGNFGCRLASVCSVGQIML